MNLAPGLMRVPAFSQDLRSDPPPSRGTFSGKQVGRYVWWAIEWVVLIFRVPNYNSADARDGILLPVVIGHYGLRFRL